SVNNLLRPTNRLTANIRVRYSKQWEGRGGIPQYPINPGGQKTRLFPYAKLVDDGEPVAIPYGYSQHYVNGLRGSDLLDWQYIPLHEKDATYADNHTERLMSSLNLTYELLSGISIDAIYQYDMQMQESGLNQTIESFYTRNLLNLYSSVVDDAIHQNIPYGDIWTRSLSKTFGHSARAQINIDKAIGEGLRINLISGGELSHLGLTGETNRLYGHNEDVWVKKVIDYHTSFPMYDGLSQNQQIPYMDVITGTINRTVSWFANAALNYKRRYTLSASMRQDAANLYGVKANQKWNPLWSLGGKWAIIQQGGKVPVLDYLAIKATYGHGGNMRQVGNHRATIVNMSNAAYTTLPYARIVEAANPELKWEDVRMINWGIEFQLKKRRLYGSVELFDKKSTDLITRVPLDATTGILNALRNVGSMAGKGIDIQLGTQFQMGEHRFDMKGNFSMVRDRVTEYFSDPLQSRYIVVNGGTSFTTILDKPTYPVYSFRFDGLD